jgi:hypothetical protein
MLVNVCFVLAAIFFLLGFFNFTFNTGNPQKAHTYTWISGGLFWVVMGLWVVPILLH